MNPFPALAFALLLPAAALAQTETVVTGRIEGQAADGSRGTINFTCRGEPACAGLYQASVTPAGCPNAITFAGAIRASGLDLARNGLLSPVFVVSGASFDTARAANGACSIVGGSRTDIVIPTVGNWDGREASLAGQWRDRSPAPNLSGAVTFSANRPAPVAHPVALNVRGFINDESANVIADIKPRAQDAGRATNIYVFAVAPAARVRGAAVAKDDPVQCVLAQLTAGGQLATTSASDLQAALNTVLTSQGASVTVLNNLAAPPLAGTTFYVGYGSSPSSMLANGTNRSTATIPGDSVCAPEAPTTGWWWNPAEPGRGFSVEVQGSNLFFAGFLYDESGRSSWYVATGAASMDGSYFTGDLYAARGGQTLGGPYNGPPQLTSVGTITLAFNSATTGTMVWPGGAVPLTRFDIVPGGAADPGALPHPENGWWWNPAESGRGFFLEWQGGTLDMAGYLYDDQGNPVWYLGWNTMPPGNGTFSGTWWSYGNGQTLTGAWRQNQRVNDNVAPVTVEFTSSTTAIMTLPNGRTTALQRHRF